jgi:hypothetical protein
MKLAGPVESAYLASSTVLAMISLREIVHLASSRSF